MELKLDLNQEQLRDVAAAAILKSIDDAGKAALLRQAIQHLLTPNQTGYGPKHSPLQDAFNVALRTLAVEQVREMLSTDTEVRQQLKSILDEVASKVFQQQREQVVEAVSTAFVQALEKAAGSRY